MEGKVGLVVEGGGLRAMYAAGVLDALLEANVHFDAVIGVSAGAIHGASFVSGQKGRSLRYTLKYCGGDKLFGFKNLIKTGSFMNNEFCYHTLPDELDVYDHEAFRKRNIPFYVVASNIETGKPEYFRMTDMLSQIDLLQASASLPYISRPVKWEGKKLLDGGCLDPVPLRFMQSLGFERNVVVLTQKSAVRKKDRDALLSSVFYRKYPNFVRGFKETDAKFNELLSSLPEASDDKVFVIRPSEVLSTPRLTHDPEKIRATYDLGYRNGSSRMEALAEWLERK